MTSETIAQAYNRWASVYDLVFGSVFRQGRSAAIEVAERIGSTVLEVGVGTGISLPEYSPDTRVTGVDISADTLAKARRRVRRLGLGNIERLELGNAEALAFPNDAFDVVVAQYVVSAVGREPLEAFSPAPAYVSGRTVDAEESVVAVAVKGDLPGDPLGEADVAASSRVLGPRQQKSLLAFPCGDGARRGGRKGGGDVFEHGAVEPSHVTAP